MGKEIQKNLLDNLMGHQQLIRYVAQASLLELANHGIFNKFYVMVTNG